jgi:hypothetical protein
VSWSTVGLKHLKSVHFWLAIIVFLGISLRLREFLAFRSLWLDEVALLLQIKRRSYEALLAKGVMGNQGAPAAYLLLSKLSLERLASLEVGARIVSLVCGIGAMIGSAWLVVRSFRNSMTRLLGLLLIATSPLLIYYTAEGKHYMQEVFITVLIVCSSLRYEEGRLSLPMFGGIGLLSVWFSHNAAVVLCACGIHLIVTAMKAGERRRALALIFFSAAWLISFSLHAVSNMRALFGNKDLFTYWGHGLAPWRKGFVAVVWWIDDVWERLMGYVFIPPETPGMLGLSSPWWLWAWQCSLIALVVLGLVRMFRERSPLAPYVVLILGVAFTLALLRISPFSSRLILYTVPFLLLSAASGVVWLHERARGGRPILTSLAVGAFIVVAGPSIAISTERGIRPVDRSDMKEALRYLAEARTSDDLLVMRRADSTVAALYTKRDPSLSMPFLIADWKIVNPQVMCARLRKRVAIAPDRPIWIVGVLQADEVAQAVDDLEQRCCEVIHREQREGFFAARLECMTSPAPQGTQDMRGLAE